MASAEEVKDSWEEHSVGDDEDDDEDEDEDEEPPPLADEDSDDEFNSKKEREKANSNMDSDEYDDDSENWCSSDGSSDKTLTAKEIKMLKRKADRNFQKKKYQLALNEYLNIIKNFGANDEADQDELEIRLNAANCHLSLQNYPEALNQMVIYFRKSKPENRPAESYSAFSKSFFMTCQPEKAAFVAIMGLDQHKSDTTLSSIIKHLSHAYYPSIKILQEYLSNISDATYLLKDLDSIPVADELSYLVSVDELTKSFARFKSKNQDGAESDDSKSEISEASATEINFSNLPQSIEKATRAFRAETFGLAAHEFGQAVLEASHQPEDVRCVLSYCQSMAILRSRSLDSFKSGLSIIEGLLEKASKRPYIYYGMALYLVALKKSESEVTDIVEKGQHELSAMEQIQYSWTFPMLSELFKESGQSNLGSLFDDVTRDVKTPKEADAVCRHERCEQITSGDLFPSRCEILATDFDFKGYYTLICQERCDVDFHTQCWKNLKEDEDVNNDKEFLGRECLTPDCAGVVVKIVITKESGEKKEIEADEANIASVKVPQKWNERRAGSAVQAGGNGQKESQPGQPSSSSSKATKKSTKKEGSTEATSDDKSAKKKWPPDPESCSEFVMPNAQAQETEAKLAAENLSKCMARLSLYEKDRADLAKKLEDAKIHSKRQSEEISRLKGDLSAEQQTTHRLLHQNEKLQNENLQLKKSGKALQTSQEYYTWRLAHEECVKYLRLLDFLNVEALFDQSPTLHRCLREYKLTAERTKRQMDVLATEANRELASQVQMPIGLEESEFRSLLLQAEEKMNTMTLQIKSEMQKTFRDQTARLSSQLFSSSSPTQSPVKTYDRLPPQIASGGNSSGVASSRNSSSGATAPPKVFATAPPKVFAAAPPMAVAAGGASVGGKLDKLVERVQEFFPNNTKAEILNKIETVRKSNNGNLKGLRVTDLVEEIGKLGQSSSTSSSHFDSTQVECAICMEDMKSKSSIMTLNPCGHCFHRDCIKAWFQEKRDCPFCRAYVVPPDEFPHLQSYGRR